MRVLLALVVAAVWYEAATVARWGYWLPARVETAVPYLTRVQDAALRNGERVEAVNGRLLRHPEDWQQAFLDAPVGSLIRVQLAERRDAVEVRVPQPRLTWQIGIAVAIWLVLMSTLMYRAWNRPDARGQLALLGIVAGMTIVFISRITSWPLHSVLPWLARALVEMAAASTPILSLLAFPTRTAWLRPLAWAVLALMPPFAVATALVGYSNVRLAVLLDFGNEVVLDLIRTLFLLRLYGKLCSPLPGR